MDCGVVGCVLSRRSRRGQQCLLVVLLSRRGHLVLLVLLMLWVRAPHQTRRALMLPAVLCLCMSRPTARCCRL